MACSTPIIGSDDSADARGVRSLERELQLILDNAGVGIVYVRNRTIERCNRQFAQIFGYEGAESLQGCSTAVLYPDTGSFQRLGDAAYPLLATGASYREETQMRRRGGDLFWVAQTGKLIDSEDPEQGSIWIVDDINERKQIELQRDALLHEQQLIFENALVGIVFLQNRVITRCNRRFEELFGYGPGELNHASTRQWYLSDEDWAATGVLYRDVLAQGQVYQGEMRLRKKNGDLFWCAVMSKAVDPTDMSAGSVWSAYDITDRKCAEAEVGRVHRELEALVESRTSELRDTIEQLRAEVKFRQKAEDELRRLAFVDTLTGLPNRLSLSEQGASLLADTVSGHSALAVMCLDLDHFKTINDSLGHEVGDHVLQVFAHKLRRSLPTEVLFGRMSGDRFILAFPKADGASAVRWADRLVAWSCEGLRVGEHRLMANVSVGVALCPEHGSHFEQLASKADTALNQAKAAGRRTWRLFTAKMLAQSERTLVLHNALRSALERQQLELYYQPQVDLVSGRLTGAEALLRWHHPELGMVSPAEFIPVAEDTGLILSIGAWVMRTACQQLRQWHQAGLACPRVSVNLSLVQFRHTDLVAQVQQALHAADLSPNCLELELTERVTMNDAQEALAVIQQLHDIGIYLAIDDFGTGYSSFSYLKRFAVQRVKIDQSFVRDLHTDPDDKAIVDAIIGVSQRLGLETIAEGVETQEQAHYLAQHGCQEGQGYYFGRPMPVALFEAYVRQRACPSLGMAFPVKDGC